MLVFSGVTWSMEDSQVVADAGGDPAIGVFSGKAGLLAGLALVGVYLPALRDPPRSLGAALCLFWLLAFASVLWAGTVGTVLFAITHLTLLLAAAMLAHRLLGFARALRLVWLVSAALILLSVALAATGDPHAVMGGTHAGRWRGLFAHKNSFAPFLAVNLLIALFAQASLKLPVVLVVAMVAVDLVALFFANSATADIAAAAGIAAGIALLPIRNRAVRTLWRIGAIAVACVLGGVLLLQPGVTGEALGRDTTMSGRAAMWAQAMPLTVERPLGTGYGSGGGSRVSIELQKRMHRAINLSVQSGYLNLALELGWGAVVLFALWAGGGMLSVLFSRRASSAQTLLAALLAAMIVESVSEVNACFAPGWLLLVTMLPMIEARRAMRPRLRLLRRRYARRTVTPSAPRTDRAYP
ncbi:O-antigen ligase family protein [Sphingomonas sp. NFR15]|uniref:O-antigen ligase family protein n=1 Tax=Sphingomonas sp. NFR15 TaxID=1566282 RepID=UPI0015A019A8|nr:O-antigen ligase family protein [Sphingomonas sp. NFR15]